MDELASLLCTWNNLQKKQQQQQCKCRQLQQEQQQGKEDVKKEEQFNQRHEEKKIEETAEVVPQKNNLTAEKQHRERPAQVSESFQQEWTDKGALQQGHSQQKLLEDTQQQHVLLQKTQQPDLRQQQENQQHQEYQQQPEYQQQLQQQRQQQSQQQNVPLRGQSHCLRSKKRQQQPLREEQQHLQGSNKPGVEQQGHCSDGAAAPAAVGFAATASTSETRNCHSIPMTTTTSQSRAVAFISSPTSSVLMNAADDKPRHSTDASSSTSKASVERFSFAAVESPSHEKITRESFIPAERREMGGEHGVVRSCRATQLAQHHHVRAAQQLLQKEKRLVLQQPLEELQQQKQQTRRSIIQLQNERLANDLVHEAKGEDQAQRRQKQQQKCQQEVQLENASVVDEKKPQEHRKLLSWRNDSSSISSNDGMLLLHVLLPPVGAGDAAPLYNIQKQQQQQHLQQKYEKQQLVERQQLLAQQQLEETQVLEGFHDHWETARRKEQQREKQQHEVVETRQQQNACLPNKHSMERTWQPPLNRRDSQEAESAPQQQQEIMRQQQQQPSINDINEIKSFISAIRDTMTPKTATTLFPTQRKTSTSAPAGTDEAEDIIRIKRAPCGGEEQQLLTAGEEAQVHTGEEAVKSPLHDAAGTPQAVQHATASEERTAVEEDSMRIFVDVCGAPGAWSLYLLSQAAAEQAKREQRLQQRSTTHWRLLENPTLDNQRQQQQQEILLFSRREMQQQQQQLSQTSRRQQTEIPEYSSRKLQHPHCCLDQEQVQQQCLEREQQRQQSQQQGQHQQQLQQQYHQREQHQQQQCQQREQQQPVLRSKGESHREDKRVDASGAREAEEVWSSTVQCRSSLKSGFKCCTSSAAAAVEVDIASISVCERTQVSTANTAKGFLHDLQQQRQQQSFSHHRRRAYTRAATAEEASGKEEESSSKAQAGAAERIILAATTAAAEAVQEGEVGDVFPSYIAADEVGRRDAEREKTTSGETGRQTLPPMKEEGKEVCDNRGPTVLGFGVTLNSATGKSAESHGCCLWYKQLERHPQWEGQ